MGRGSQPRAQVRKMRGHPDKSEVKRVRFGIGGVWRHGDHQPRYKGALKLWWRLMQGKNHISFHGLHATRHGKQMENGQTLCELCSWTVLKLHGGPDAPGLGIPMNYMGPDARAAPGSEDWWEYTLVSMGQQCSPRMSTASLSPLTLLNLFLYQEPSRTIKAGLGGANTALRGKMGL